MIARANALADRSSLAKQRNRTLRQRGWIQRVVQETKTVAQSIHDCRPEVLQAHTVKLRQYFRSASDVADERLLALAGAGVFESLRQSLGISLFDVQVHAGIAVTCGAVAEMQTGEGKTFAGILPAYVHALSQRGVHVATTNDYLARRDHDKLAPVFTRLGMTTGLLEDGASDEETKAAYDADVTYGPGHAFGFDYLRDQLQLQTAESAPIGSSVYARLQGQSAESKLRQRGLHASIVDEIDHVLIDDAVSPLLLSSSSQGDAPDAEIHVCAKLAAAELDDEVDFCFDRQLGSVELSQRGFDRVYADGSMAMHDKLVRPWHEYVTLALRAKHLFQRDVHYVVSEEEVQIVDASTGRIFQDRTWSDGLHQAVLAAEELPITPETHPLAKITRQRFYRYYENLGGMTGTATGCEKEFASVYGLPVNVVPLRFASLRDVQVEQISPSSADKVIAIADEVQRLNDAGRAVLIGTLNISQSLLVGEELERRGLPFQLLNGVQDADEAAIVAAAGQSGAITVATNLAGRGTDISLDATVKQLGGLHVIVTELHSLARVDRQLIGRSARCGDPGTARVFVSPEDDMFAKHAPWLARAINRRIDTNQEGLGSLCRQVGRVQRSLQRKSTQVRWQLLQRDQQNESILDRNSDPARCWQL